MKGLIENLLVAVHSEWHLTLLNIYWRLRGKGTIEFSCRNCGFTLKYAHPRVALIGGLGHIVGECPRSQGEGGRVNVRAEFWCAGGKA